MNEFKILKDDTIDGILVIQLDTILNNSNIHSLSNILLDAEKSSYNDIILDCSKLEFVSSAGIGVIVSRNRSICTKGKQLILYDIPDVVQFVLNELDVADLLNIKSNLNELIQVG